MANFVDDLDEIEALLSSGIKSSKAVAYSTLLHLQQRCGAGADDESSIGILVRRSRSLLNFMIEDVFDDDEEIAAQACKCLGFMLYHPSIVAAISVDVAGVVMQSLAKLIMSTKMKSVCNLGVWCISIQQFNASFVNLHFEPLMMAIVFALDNPAGSLSTTFEAVQAILKIASQLNDRIKETSNVWAPPVYTRLISESKKERDVSERCLLKLQSIFCPPTPALAKVVVCDMKNKLLPGLKELRSQGGMAQAVKAWGWFISLIGPHVLQNRRLLNEMLGFIEQAFTDLRPQVQIASLVAWERLIDALMYHPLQACDLCVFSDNLDQESRSFQVKHGTEANGFYKCMKLIMTPLIGVISSKCNTSVQSACMKAWCYLLHKLGIYVNCPAVLKVTFAPLLKAVFLTGPNKMSTWLLNLFVDILDDSVSAKYITGGLTSPVKLQVNCVPSEGLSKCYPINWLPWGVDQLELYMDIVLVLSNQGVLTNASHDYKSHMTKSTIRIYRSIMRGVQVELMRPVLNNDKVMLCLNTTLELITNLAKDAASDENAIEKLELSLHLIEATTEELDMAILGSPLYKVSLNFKGLKLFHFDEVKGVDALNIYHDSLTYMSSHLVYLTAVYFLVFAKVRSICAEPELTLQKFHSYLKRILSTCSNQGAFHVILSLMYCNADTWGFKTWMVVGKAVKDVIGGSGDVSLLKSVYDSTGYLLASCFLTYPLFICSSPLIKDSYVNYKGGKNPSPVSFSKDTDLDEVILDWRSIFDMINDASKSDRGYSRCFIEDLCTIMNKHLQNNISWNSDHILINPWREEDFHYICGNVVIYILEQVTSDMICINDCSSSGTSIHLKNMLAFTASFIQAAWSMDGTVKCTPHCLISKVFSTLTRFAGCLRQKPQIVLLIEAIHDCLLHCLTQSQTGNGRSYHLQLLWSEILNCFLKAQPPFEFDSQLLNFQALLLEKTLDHQDPSISEPTIKYWNSTYGKLLQVDYPKCLLLVLDKLSEAGIISLFKHDAVVSLKVHASPQLYRGSSTPGSCMVTTMNNRSSKRVELVEHDTWGTNCNGSNLKKPRLELTEHQKEVRRAQQGKERDCSGHGPGVRTYTSLDFSQTNDDSQELEDIRNTETILEMLKKPHQVYYTNVR